MSINLEQFHQTFFKESFEGLDGMESGLLNLQSGTPDADTVNTIFRAAHSIKGGCGTFGFTAVASLSPIATCRTWTGCSFWNGCAPMPAGGTSR